MTTASPPSPTYQGPPPKRSWVRQHWLLTVILVVLALLIAGSVLVGIALCG